ncbi:hypothetical protein [Lactococcus lactis]|uniref:hypothetical protein n=1 Tax=Lactococcus lactis TaxID=1358 RepID=UPI00288FB977|nr:hypothetical protein [Lactococcus lactis]MDT2867140.1 hypothetical protein [Lactococcus lactis]MDT2896259.1 hypothetical protein [Lactococcus lactis]MDT2948653.1 hypothetical protein [Lactococcus lactis]
MTETAKEPISNEIIPDYWMIRGEIWSDDIAFLEAHNGTSSEVQAAMDEWENYAVPLYKSPVTTDKLSVEKLQEHLLPYKKEMVQKIRDEKMQLVTADEFVKLQKESLTTIRENDILKEQLDTAKKYIEESYKADKEDNKLLNLTIEVVAKLKSDNETLKKALTEIAEIINDDIHKCDYGCDNNCELNGSLNIYSVENVQSVIDSALAAIGGDDE